MGCRSWKEYQRLPGILSIPTQFKDGDSETCKGETAYPPEVTQLTNDQTWGVGNTLYTAWQVQILVFALFL